MVVATAVVLGVAALIVGVGLYITQVRPPRAHVLTVGDHDFNAAAVARRGEYYALFEGGINTDANTLVPIVLDRMEREALLRTLAPALVGEVTDADVEVELHRRLGFGVPGVDDVDAGDDADDTAGEDAAADDAPADDGADDAAADDGADDAATDDATPGGATPDGTTADDTTADDTTGDDASAGEDAATGDADATDDTDATADAADEPLPVDEAGYADALADLLRVAGLHRDEFWDVVRAELLAERLADHFAGEVEAGGEQYFLRRFRVPSEGLARDLRERVLAGEDAAALATEFSRDAEAGAGGEIGWRPPALLDADVAAAVDGLRAGAATEVFARTLTFEFYVVEDYAANRRFEDEVRDELAAARVDTWLAEQDGPVVRRDLSDDEREWIAERIVARVRDFLGQ